MEYFIFFTRQQKFGFLLVFGVFAISSSIMLVVYTRYLGQQKKSAVARIELFLLENSSFRKSRKRLDGKDSSHRSNKSKRSY